MGNIGISVILLYICAFVIGALGKPPQKIVGGTYSAADEFPYQVSLRLYGRHFCGGSIISTRHILTAAHCLNDKVYNYNQIVVVSGTTNLYYGGTSHAVQKIKIHPSFINQEQYMFPNDIGVVTLASPIQIDASHHIIKLASKREYGGQRGVVSGWGFTQQNTNQAFPYLLKLSTNLINATWCQSYLSRQLYDAQVCSFSSSSSGTCQGDSGGPLAVGDELVGIVSFGFLCGAGLPDVYTSVYSYRKFIQEAINESGLSKEVLYPPNTKPNPNIVNRVENKVMNPVSSSTAVAPNKPNNNKSYYIFKNGAWYQVEFK